ncbi:cytochrome P450 CYP257 (plasmid) [Rhodococcus jostii RHA1]|uniref:Cytochrome P450 CYP257 n=1 Tax=Rhodococcus jostii (strain RHA1) TaxID=101510 RepID=Q0RVH0_RHOJR|nr:cytochrome P450 [Rhodococcus jostii]ABH00716.1 cytochrome P450 CYP257 [Rhodococcus jostii RHA1]
MTVRTELQGIPDLSDPETFKEGIPYEAYDQLRSLPGLPWHPAESGTLNGGFWVVTRYDEVVEILQDPARFSSVQGSIYPLPNPTGDGPMTKHILLMDPPEHSRVRRAAAKSFGPRIVANFESWIRDVVVETLDDALPLERFDWVYEVSRLVPSRVIAQILGIPLEHRGYIVEATNALFESQTVNDGGASLTREFMKIGEFMTRLGEEKLRNPADDMTTVLAQSLESGEIDLVEYQLYTASLFAAGFETTHTTISHIGHLLATEPAIRAATTRALDEGKSAALVDEFLRYITPAMRFARTATQDTEFRDQAIKKGDTLLVVFSAANRDPAAFPNPNEFNPFREDPKPLAGTGGAGLTFGAGAHRCIGHMLAKLELRILLEELHVRNIAIEMDGDAQRGASGLVNQLLALPVTVAVG